MHRRIITKAEELNFILNQWEKLHQEAEYKNIFNSISWLYPWWKAYGKDKHINICLFHNDKDLKAIASLMQYEEKKFGLKFKLMSFMGDGTFETDHMNFIIHPDYMEEAAKEIFNYVFSYKAWDVVKLNMIPEKSSLRELLDRWLKDKKIFHTLEKAACPFAKLPDNYEEYLKTRKPRFRTALRSTAKKIENKYRVDFGLHQKNELESALLTLFDIHTRRWESIDQTGNFVMEERCNFYHILSEELFIKGWLRLFYLKLDGKIVAQQYCFEYNKVIYLLQEGFEPAYSKENIGNYLRSRVFQYCIEQGVEIYDFLAGDAPHKRNWSTGIAYDLRYAIFNSSLKSRAYYYIPNLVENVKDAIRWLFPDSVFQKIKSALSG